MATARTSLILALALLHRATAGRVQSHDFTGGERGRVQPSELADFFYSSSTFDMTRGAAEALAKKEAADLSRCSVTVTQLKALFEVLYFKTTGLDLLKKDVQDQIFPLAYQHANPADLRELYSILWSLRQMNMNSKDAQQRAMELGKAHVKPALLEGLHNVVSKILPSKDKSNEQTIDLAMAGADAEVLKAQYQALTPRLSQDEALSQAVREAVKANLKGLEQRYAKDGKPYSGKGFQDYYGAGWLKEWIDAPQQKRTAMDGKDYTASEFESHYGASWDAKWSASPEATLHRISEDGKEYTLQEFASFYKDAWQSKWRAAKEVLDLCAGLSQESCSSFGTCEWKWTGDWTTSCTPSPVTVSRSCKGLNHLSCDDDNSCTWKWTGDWTTSCIPA